MKRVLLGAIAILLMTSPMAQAHSRVVSSNRRWRGSTASGDTDTSRRMVVVGRVRESAARMAEAGSRTRHIGCDTSIAAAGTGRSQGRVCRRSQIENAPG